MNIREWEIEIISGDEVGNRERSKPIYVHLHMFLLIYTKSESNWIIFKFLNMVAMRKSIVNQVD